MQRNDRAVLQRIEDAEARRRRINRAMVNPQRDPDSGEPLPNAPNRYAAQREAAQAARARLMLPPLPPLQTSPPQTDQTVGTPSWARPLTLCLLGCSKAQAAQVLGASKEQVDYALRVAYRSLDVHDIIAAGAAWRARAQAEGHTMSEDDERAARALLGCDHDTPPEPLTPRQEEAMTLLVAGVARRDLPIAMGCRPGTIHSILGDAYRRLGARGQQDAVQRYLAQRGGMSQAPYDRPMAANVNQERLEKGSKAEGPGAVNPRPGLELPP